MGGGRHCTEARGVTEEGRPFPCRTGRNGFSPAGFGEGVLLAPTRRSFYPLQAGRRSFSSASPLPHPRRRTSPCRRGQGIKWRTAAAIEVYNEPRSHRRQRHIWGGRSRPGHAVSSPSLFSRSAGASRSTGATHLGRRSRAAENQSPDQRLQGVRGMRLQATTAAPHLAAAPALPPDPIPLQAPLMHPLPLLFNFSSAVWVVP